jgi:hypothetical protein
VDADQVARVTVPPTTLCLYRALSWMPYRAIRLIHFALEWLALVAVIRVLTPLIPRPRLRVGFLVLTAVLVAAGAFWRMHTERGQIYVLHALLLALGSQWAYRARLDSWRAGAAFGLAVALRPSLAPLLLAFLVLGRFRTAVGGFAAAALAVGLTVPVVGVGVWQSYFQMGDDYYLGLWAPERLPPAPVPPDTHAEGFDFGYIIVDPGAVPNTFGSTYRQVQGWLGLPVIDLGRWSKAGMAGLTLALLAVLAVGRRRAARSPRAALLLILAVVLDLEYFLPFRWPYADIHWLVPLGLAVPCLASPRPGPWGALVCVLGGLLIGNSLALTPDPYVVRLGRTYLLAGGLTGLAVWAWARAGRTAGTRTTGDRLPRS